MKFRSLFIIGIAGAFASIVIGKASCPSSASTTRATRAEEISFHSTLDGITLHGTLERPVGKRRGAVLMLVGSGKADRNESVPASKTYSGKPEQLFAPISLALSKAGYETLRYDKRGVLDGNDNVDPAIWKTADREHLISDAVDAAKYLSAKSGVPTNQLVLLGHSEGTIVAVETALALGGEVKALILLGAMGRSMKDMLHYQIVESRSKRTAGVDEISTPEK